jgi:hypothetical protein
MSAAQSREINTPLESMNSFPVDPFGLDWMGFDLQDFPMDLNFTAETSRQETPTTQPVSQTEGTNKEGAPDVATNGAPNARPKSADLFILLAGCSCSCSFIRLHFGIPWVGFLTNRPTYWEPTHWVGK